jgi:hypothetical protein
MSSQLHGPAALPRGKSPRYLLDMRLDGPQSQSRRRGEGKILDPTEIRTPAPRSSSRLRYSGSPTVLQMNVDFYLFINILRG